MGKEKSLHCGQSVHPLNTHGRSKALAERRLFEMHTHSIVLRLGWMLDLSSGVVGSASLRRSGGDTLVGFVLASN